MMDAKTLTQIQQTHAPDDRDVDVGRILELVKDVIKKDPHTTELTCKCSAGDEDATTMRVFNMLSSYSWVAKVAIALGELAITYGEFHLVVKLYDTDSIAKSVATLKQLPGSKKQANTQLDALNNLITLMLDVTHRMIKFKKLSPNNYLSSAEQLLSSIANIHIPEAAHWIIKSVVACVTQIANPIDMGDQYTTLTTEASSHAGEGKIIRDILKEQLKTIKRQIADQEHRKAYYDLVRVFELPQPDKIKIIFKHFIDIKDEHPLDIGPAGSNKSKVNVDELFTGKTVLLLISDLELSQEELKILEKNYNGRSRSSYEILWIPIIHTDSWTGQDHEKFKERKSKMSWHTLSNPEGLKPGFIRYIKEEWKFSKKTMLVVLDHKGNVACQNALFMYLDWGNEAFPFTATKEAALWSKETWSFERFLARLEPQFKNWIQERKLICMYGGIDIKWIQAFAETAKDVAAKIKGIDLEIIYVGKSNAKEETMREIEGLLKNKKLGHYLPNITGKLNFWTRLEGTMYYHMQHVKNVENDPLIKEAMTVLSLDGSAQGWATMWFGSSDKERVTGSTLKESLSEFGRKWGENVGREEFIHALRKHIKDNPKAHHCNKLVLPGNAGGIPERVVCVECGEPMEKYFMYRCCKDKPSSLAS